MATRAKAALTAGKAIIAVNPGGAGVAVADLLGRIGTDVLFIDCERSAIGIESVGPMARAAQVHGTAAVVRSYSAEPAILTRYLDRGIDGIVVPHVESAAAARTIVEVARYACGPAASDLIVVAQIESRAGIAALDAILGVSGIDVLLIGPNDLAHSLGFGGDVSHPQVVDTVERVARRIREAGRAFGVPATRDTAAEWVRKGATFLYHPLEWLVRPSLERLQLALKS